MKAAKARTVEAGGRADGAAKSRRSGTGKRVQTKRGGASTSWPLFLMAHDALMARLEERLKAVDLPESSWFVVLWVLDRSPERRLRMSDLADASVITRSNLTRLIDRMEKAGVVVRERVAGDRRGAYAVLTKDGVAMKERMWAVYGPAVDDLFGRHLSAKDDTLLKGLMTRLLAAAHPASLL